MRNKNILFGALIILSTLIACDAKEPTVIATTTPEPEVTEPVVIATMPPGEWDYIVLGDSITLDYPELIKTVIEADYEGAVTITILDRHIGGQSSSKLLDELLNDERLRREIRGAELITFLVPVGVCQRAWVVYEHGGNCGGDDNEDCLRDCLATFKADVTAIFAELVSLRSPSEALIRVHDVYQFGTSRSQVNGTFDVLNSYWLEGNSHVHATAAIYGIPVANVYDAFMGADGRQPPEEQGLVQADMIHTTPEGQQLIADLLLEFGYELAEPSDE